MRRSHGHMLIGVLLTTRALVYVHIEAAQAAVRLRGKGSTKLKQLECRNSASVNSAAGWGVRSYLGGV